MSRAYTFEEAMEDIFKHHDEQEYKLRMKQESIAKELIMNKTEREIEKAKTIVRLEAKVDDLTGLVEMVLALLEEKRK